MSKMVHNVLNIIMILVVSLFIMVVSTAIHTGRSLYDLIENLDRAMLLHLSLSSLFLILFAMLFAAVLSLISKFINRIFGNKKRIDSRFVVYLWFFLLIFLFKLLYVLNTHQPVNKAYTAQSMVEFRKSFG